MNGPMDLPIGAVLLLAAAMLWWRASLQARELARAAAQRFCRQQGWQWLDQTVSLCGLWWVRDPDRLSLRWRYRFDYSPDGALRLTGQVLLIGRRIGEIRAWREDGTQLVDVPRRAEADP